MRSKRINRKMTHRKRKKRTKNKRTKYRKNTKSKRRKSKRRKSKRRKTKTKRRRKRGKRGNKFQKLLTQKYVEQFRSPHRAPADCAVCSLNFLNVLPKETLQDMIDEVGCKGTSLYEILGYFNSAYGSQYNFIWQPSELLKDSNLNYRYGYMNSYLDMLKSRLRPGYVSLLFIGRRSESGHYVTIGKDVYGEIVLFEPQYNPKTSNLGIYKGNAEVIRYLVSNNAFNVMILDSNLVENRDAFNTNISIPMETSELNYRCKLKNRDNIKQEDMEYGKLIRQLETRQLGKENYYIR